MRFSELNPKFVQLTRTDEPSNNWGFHEVETLGEADGVMFLCPTHFQKNKGSKGTHSIICWFEARNIPAELTPGPGRWVASGDLNNLTLSPSINLGDDHWHGHITNGEVT